MLLTKHIETKSPEIHSRTFYEFKRLFIDTGVLDAKLFIIYTQMLIRADVLLELYKEEKRKRGDFTYNTIPQANIKPAKDSIANARLFFKHCNAYTLNSP